jgi:hypothetical protein
MDAHIRTWHCMQLIKIWSQKTISEKYQTNVRGNCPCLQDMHLLFIQPGFYLVLWKALIINEENTKEIMTVKEFVYIWYKVMLIYK